MCLVIFIYQIHLLSKEMYKPLHFQIADWVVWLFTFILNLRSFSIKNNMNYARVNVILTIIRLYLELF